MTTLRLAGGVNSSSVLARLRSGLAVGAALGVLALGLGVCGPALAQNDAQPQNPEQAAQPEQLTTPDNQPLPWFIGTVSQNIGVIDRPRPEYDAKGVPLGAFRLFPTLVAGVNYDDNVRRVDGGPADWYFEQAPALRLQSQWGRHFLEVYGGVDNYNYASQDALNLTDWNIGADGRYDISRALVIGALGNYGEYHEGLESPNTVGGQASPTGYFRSHGEVTAKYMPGNFGFDTGVSVTRYTWGMTSLIGGTKTSNSDRDETEFQIYARGLYTLYPGYAAFVKLLYDNRDFDQFYDRAGLHRASHGYRINAGVDLQLSNLLEGEIFIGYLEQHYAKNVPVPLPDVSGADYGINLHWYATPLLTVHLTGEREVSDITIYQAAATEDSTIKLSADYEFRRNIIVQAFVSYRNSSFIGLSREDEYPGAGVKGRWLMNSYMSADLGFNFFKRSSDIPAVQFDDNTVTLALNLHV